MTKFSIRDTAFSGYRLLAAKPAATLAWFIFGLAVTVGMTALTVWLAGPQLAALKAMQTSGERPDPATMMNLTSQILPVTLLGFIVPLITGAILMAAIVRAVVRPQQKGLGYLRLGGDEFRLFVVSLVLTLVFMVPVLIAYGGGMAGMFASAGPRAAAMAMQGRGSLAVTAMIAAGAGAVPGLALLTWLCVKLSLAAPQTVAERSIRIFNSWGLIRGLFWRTLATYVLAAIPAALGYAALIAVVSQVRAVGVMQALQPDFGSMAIAFSGLQVAVLVARAALQVLYTAALLVPATMIYTAIAGEPLALADDEVEDEEDWASFRLQLFWT